jgi:hypothetical protein
MVFKIGVCKQKGELGHGVLCWKKGGNAQDDEVLVVVLSSGAGVLTDGHTQSMLACVCIRRLEKGF